jgi:hypothetical protein
MTREEFTQFRQVYGGQAAPGVAQGLWPHAPLAPRELHFWFRRLKGFPLDRLLEALDALSMHDRRQAPSVDQVVDALKTLAPPPVPIPAWQQQMARDRGLTVAQLLAEARPAHGDHDIATCWREISDHDWHLRGREAELLAAYARFAAAYPHDRAFWEAQRAQVQTHRTTPPHRRTAATVETFTHVGALLGRKGGGHV